MSGAHGGRPVTLIGYSMGGRWASGESPSVLLTECKAGQLASAQIEQLRLRMLHCYWVGQHRAVHQRSRPVQCKDSAAVHAQAGVPLPAGAGALPRKGHRGARGLFRRPHRRHPRALGARALRRGRPPGQRLLFAGLGAPPVLAPFLLLHRSHLGLLGCGLCCTPSRSAPQDWVGCCSCRSASLIMAS